jgi:hypothetical protein
MLIKATTPIKRFTGFDWRLAWLNFLVWLETTFTTTPAASYNATLFKSGEK